MTRTVSMKTLLQFIVVVAVIVCLSVVSNRIWGGKTEKLPEKTQWIIADQMTVGQFGQANQLANPILKEIFSLQSKQDLEKKLSDYGNADAIQTLVVKKMALAAEHASKNWQKIVLKFSLWFVFLSAIFWGFKKRALSAVVRKRLLAAAVLIFGVILGSDPSPMGTVKDAIHLFGSTKAIFPPRLIALTVFLLIVFAANKYICAWGCQIGALQDLLFHLNQNAKGQALLVRQFKPPFVVTNTIRVLFLAIFTVLAFAWGVDIIAPIDPFQLYKPLSLGLGGAIFVGLLLLASLFIYRPWCHLFCPFGLVGWGIEKISRVHINVQYDTCIACRKCVQACPSTVMGAILEQNKKTIPDCFSCYTCRDVCPTGSIRFSSDRRQAPPPDHFSRQR